MALNDLIHVLKLATDGNEILMCRIIKPIKIKKLAVQFY
jgi:hypothetical protein